MKKIACSYSKCGDRRIHYEQPDTLRGTQYIRITGNHTGPMYCSMECAMYDGFINARGERKIPQLNKVFEDMDSFADLEEDWDSYHGLPTSKESVINSRKFLFDLFDSENPRFEWQIPDVSPTPNGEIYLSWDIGKYTVSVIIGEDEKKVRYLTYEIGSGTRADLSKMSLSDAVIELKEDFLNHEKENIPIT